MGVGERKDDMKKGRRVWICGQITGKWIGRGTPWEFQGVFTDKKKADAACRDGSYFFFPAWPNEELPHEAIFALRAEYPRLEKGG